MIPAAAVEAAAKVLYLEDHLWDEPWEAATMAAKYRTNARLALEAAAPHLLAPLLTLADERDKVHGTIRGHITTHELRTMLNNKGEK